MHLQASYPIKASNQRSSLYVISPRYLLQRPTSATYHVLSNQHIRAAQSQANLKSLETLPRPSMRAKLRVPTAPRTFLHPTKTQRITTTIPITKTRKKQSQAASTLDIAKKKQNTTTRITQMGRKGGSLPSP